MCCSRFSQPPPALPPLFASGTGNPICPSTASHERKGKQTAAATRAETGSLFWSSWQNVSANNPHGVLLFLLVILFCASLPPGYAMPRSTRRIGQKLVLLERMSTCVCPREGDGRERKRDGRDKRKSQKNVEDKGPSLLVFHSP